MTQARNGVCGGSSRAAVRRSVARAVGAAVVAVVTAPALAASADARTGPGSAAATDARAAAACTDSAGVTVVVDFGPYGGVQTGCAPGDAGTGLDALDAAGFGWEGTQQFWDVVCRIAGLPTPDDDQCVRTPPGDAYWSYWHAPRGGSWTYSTLGASSFDPPAGSVEGWAFGSGELPGVAPPDVIAPPPPPPPPTSIAAQPDPEPTAAEEAPAPTRGGSSAASPSTPPSPTLSSRATTAPSTASAPSSATTSATASPTDSATRSSPAGVVATDPGDDSSPVGAAIGIAAAGLIAAVAGVVALRRRRTDPTG